ncbi:MAG: chemotaxis protein MotB [Clostridia bacterium]|nr:chemotaxis protein MotB [Clostridia bacterium]
MIRDRFKKKQEDNSNEWMTTFSDLMTLLLVFFVLLFSFSVINRVKFEQFLASYQGIGILENSASIVDEDTVTPDNQNFESAEAAAALAHAQELMETFQIVENFLAENGLDDMVQVRYEQRGIALDIKEKILFDSGKADLKPEAKKLLNKLSELLLEIDNEIRVEGYTDNRPIHTLLFPTNWELSTTRAVRVIRYFVENFDLNPERFEAVGYGEYRPLYPNDTPEHMAENRRVVLLLGAKTFKPTTKKNR